VAVLCVRLSVEVLEAVRVEAPEAEIQAVTGVERAAAPSDLLS